MLIRTIRKTSLVMVLTIASAFLFAASGGKKKGTATAKNNLSIKQSTQALSLRSGYKFKGNKLLVTDANKQQYFSLNSYNTIKKGNTTYFIASKHVMNKKPEIVVDQNRFVSVKLLKMKLD
jgi:hypothetical protein